PRRSPRCGCGRCSVRLPNRSPFPARSPPRSAPCSSSRPGASAVLLHELVGILVRVVQTGRPRVLVRELREARAQLLPVLHGGRPQEVGQVVALLLGEVLVVGVARVLDGGPPLVAAGLGRRGPADALADLVVVVDGVLRLVLAALDLLQ